MRTHRKYAPLLLWDDAARLREAVQLKHLISARVEPIVRGLRGGALMDLVFCANDRIAVVPCIEIAPEMLQEREMSAFVWPHEPAHAAGGERTEEIERALLGWIESLTLARQLNGEVVRSFGDRATAAVAAEAREARFLGAAPYAQVIQDGAPYLYAARFAESARVAVRDRRGAYGAALLGRHAREVCADFGGEQRNALAERWFGKRFSPLPAGDERFDVSLYEGGTQTIEAGVRIALDDGVQAPVQAATPVPTDVMISFDVQDAPPCRSFSVLREPRPAPREAFIAPAPAPAGGSSGRILMLLREDYLRAPDADTDEAHALAALLRAEGFTVDLAAPAAARPAAYDLIHAFTLARVDELLPALSAAHGARIPVVLTPFFQDLRAGGTWGTAIVRGVLASSNDEIDIEDALGLVAQRRLEAPGVSAKAQEPFPGYEPALRAALSTAGAVLTGTGDEERELRALGYAGPAFRAWPCLTDAEPGLAPAAGEYVLMHAPLEARSNALLLVRAASAARLPLLVAGPVTEPEYARAVKEQAGERVAFLPEPDAATAAALYRGARLYADVAWVRFGAHRLVRAAACGAALVASAGSGLRAALGPETVREVDPASQREIALALSDGWMHAGKQRKALDAAARQAGALADPRGALVAAAQAYAAAQQMHSHA